MLCVAVTGALLSACGGGSQSIPGPPATSGATQAVSAAGGSITTTLGSQTVTVGIPAGAFPSGATVSITEYSAATLPVPFAAAGRTTLSVPAGAVVLGGILIDAGGAAPALPLNLSLGGATVPSGSIPRLSGYNAAAFDDVAAMTASGTTVSTVANIAFPGATLATKTLYVFYAVPTASAGAGDGTVTVAGPASVLTASQGTYTASEATSNGFPYLARTFTFGVSTPTVGTIGAATGVLTASALGGTGTVSATDTAITTRIGTLVVSAASSRPGAPGISAAYTGSLTETIANNAIRSAPVTSTSTSAVSSTLASTTNTSGNTVFTLSEADAGPLSTVSTTTVATVAYQASGASTNVRALSTLATDSNGVKYQTTFGANNGLETILPEVAGSFSNDAKESYLETDPGLSSVGTTVSVDREVNADGTYVQNNGGTLASGTIVNNVATENANESGTLLLNSVAGGRLFTFAAPAGGSITYTYFNGSSGTTTPTTVPNWIPAQASPSIETDTITPGSALDPSCKPSASFPTTASKVQQKITIADAVFGTLETRMSTSYDAPGPGTICTVVSDTIAMFYDYSEQEGARLTPSGSATVPVETIAISETSSLQSFTIPVASVARASSSLGGSPSVVRSTQSAVGGVVLPRSVLVAHVVHLAHQEALKRLTMLNAQGGTH